MKKFGHYEVTAELGRGGMGVVYAGFEPSLNRKVAIKALGEHLINDKDLVERFMREAKATAALNDPNVIQIYFIGEEQGQPYFAMEYIDGQSLDDILKGNKALTVKHAKNILKQACLGLSAAHKKDLVHRDIKPANLMLTTEGVLKVVDFGIARTREYGDKLTNTGEFVGTPGYLSPEVCVGKEVDARSDIFSLGIVFYEMLAGKVPFENDSPLGLMLEVVQSEIPDIRNLNNKVDKKTSFILNKMIAKAPEDRYQTCDEIIRDLGNVIANEKLENIKQAAAEVKATKVSRATKKASQQVTMPSAQAITAQNLQMQPKAKGSKKWLVAATLFAVLGAGAFGYVNGYLPFPKHDNSSTTTTALLDNDLASSQQATNKTTNDTQSAAQLTDISSDNNSQNSSENATSNTDAKKPGLMAGIGKMFDNDEKDEAVTKDNNKIDFNQNNTDNTIKDVIQITEVAAANQDLSQDSNNQEPQNETSNTQEMVQVSVPDTSEMLAVADKTRLQVAAETKAEIPPIATKTIEKVVQTSVQKPMVKYKPKPKPVVLNKGVVVIAFGDPAVANPIEKILESELRAKGVKVMNEQFIPGMSRLLQNGLDLAQLKNLIQKNGGQAMVIANVNHVGVQQLNYAGRTSELINAQLDVDAYDIKTGKNIGNGYGSKLNYTSLNATDQATDAVMQFTDRLTASLRKRI